MCKLKSKTLVDSAEEPSDQRTLLRIAKIILDRLTTPPDNALEPIHNHQQSLTTLWRELRQSHQRLAYCHTRGWKEACRCQQSSLNSLLDDIMQHARGIQEKTRLLVDSRDKTPLTLGQVMADIKAIYEEFEHVDLDIRNRKIRVETEPVVLNEIHLGRFAIELNLQRLTEHRRSGCYRVIALDPNPAASRDSVTHPHVRDEELCEGDAVMAIRNALANGRLCDFFIMVRSVLNTYNASSPYVALDQWDGVSCHDCDDTINEDQVHYCESCSHDFCDECFTYCRCCDRDRCRGCLDTCPACDEYVCSRCQSDCRDCGKRICKNCLEDDLCPECREKAEENHDDDPSTTTNTDPEQKPAVAA